MIIALLIIFLSSCFNKNIIKIDNNIYKVNTPPSEEKDLIDLLEEYSKLKNQQDLDYEIKISEKKIQISEFMENNKFLLHYYDIGSYIYEFLVHDEIIEKLKNIKTYLVKEGISLREGSEYLGLNPKKMEIIKFLMYINKNFSLKDRILIRDLKNIESFGQFSSLVFKKIKNLNILEVNKNANEQRSVLPKNNWLECILKLKEIDTGKKIKYINLLLEDFNVDLKEENWRGENILHYACREDTEIKVIDLLIQKGADINKKEKILGFTPIFFAIKKGKFEIIKYLVDNKDKLNINIFEIDQNKRTFLHHASISLNELEIRWKNKNDTSEENKKNIKSYYLIINYLIKKIFEVVKSDLMEEIEKKDHYNKTFYNYFVYRNEEDFWNSSSLERFLFSYSSLFFTNKMLKLILKNKKIEFENEDEIVIGEDKIHSGYLVNCGNYLLLEYIFANKDNEETLKTLSSRLIGWIFHNSDRINTKILNLLLKFNEKDISSFYRIESQESAIHPLSLSIIQDNYEAFKIILKKTSNINYLNTDKGEYADEDLGTTPLNETVKYGKLDMFNLLLKRKDLDINKQDEIGYTAAHYAAEFRRIEMLKILISRSSGLKKIKNKGGETPEDIAKEKRKQRYFKNLRFGKYR